MPLSAYLTRRVPMGRIVVAHAWSEADQNDPDEPKESSIARQLRRAMEWRAQLDSGEMPTQAAIASREGISRARVTQLLHLLSSLG